MVQKERIQYIRRAFASDEIFYDTVLRKIHYRLPDDATAVNTLHLHSFVPDAPFRVYFDPTYRCNLRCRHCITSSSPDASNVDEMSLQRMQQLFNELSSIGVLEIAITGGEPFMLPNIFDIIECAQKSGLNLSIASNGTLISKKRAEKLAKLNVRDIRISIDGYEDINDDIRGQGSYKKAIKGIKNLLFAEVPVSVRMTLTKNTHNSIERLFRELNEIGIKNLKAAVIKEAGNATREENSDLLGYQPTEDAMWYLIELGTKYQIDVELSSDDFDLEPLFTNDKKLRKSGNDTCGAGFETAYISPEGNILICSSVPHVTFGNIKNSCFTDVWEGTIAKRFRQMAIASGERKLCNINFINIWQASEIVKMEKSDKLILATAE